ncbi:MAG TPA: hypothetical protein VFP98_01280, partial [Candidatus Polarisedimenticolia bacterium]|nr:hypothetical protein [Candidatus Polarisedimenticolia bacterium]
MPASHRVALALVFVLLAALSLRQVGSLDAGFHLKAGERMLQGAGWPRTDPFTFTINDHPWVDTSWGYQVLLAAVHSIAGAPGITLMHAALVLLVFFTLYRTSRLPPFDPSTLILVLLASAVACEMRYEARPELVSWLMLALVLHLLHRHAEGLGSALPALAAIHLIWANLHGLFVLGWAAIACFLAGLWLRHRRLDRRLAFWGAVSVMITLANPYGWRGALFPFTLATRLGGDNVFGQSIGEFVSPFTLGLSEQFPFYPRAPIGAFAVIAALAILSTLLHLRQRRYWYCLLTLALAPLAFGMVRNIPLLVVSCVPGIVW